MVAARRNSPLVVRRAGTGENFVASDVAAFIEHTREAIELGQDQVVDVTPESVTITDFAGNPAETRPFEVTWDLSAAEKSGYDWFMRKEIYEQPRAVADTLLGRYNPDGSLTLDELHIPESELRSIDKIIIVACGTAYYEAWWPSTPSSTGRGSLRGRDRQRVPLPRPDHHPLDARRDAQPVRGDRRHPDGHPARSRTARQGDRDLQHQRRHHPARVGRGHLHPRRSRDRRGLHQGFPHPGGRLLPARYLAQVRGTMYDDEIHAVMTELAATPPLIQKVLDELDPIKELAKRFIDQKSVLFLGRHVGYPVALEGALKLKEIAYLHAEGFPAGELKHGPIALVEEGIPIFIVVPPQGRDQLHDKVVSNIQEVRARGALTIVLAEEGDHEVAPYADVLFRLPKVSTLLQPLVATVPLQMFACELATLKGYDVDQPRNLAKSVTVE